MKPVVNGLRCYQCDFQIKGQWRTWYRYAKNIQACRTQTNKAIQKEYALSYGHYTLLIEAYRIARTAQEV